MEDFNKGLLSGRISKKTVRRVNSKSENNPQFAIANINLAVNYYDKSEKATKALYFPIKIVGQQAEYIEKYLDVGDELYVTGEWRPNEWTSKNGEKHREIYLEAREIKLVVRKNQVQKALLRSRKSRLLQQRVRIEIIRGSILMMSWKMMNCRSKFKLVKRR